MRSFYVQSIPPRAYFNWVSRDYDTELSVEMGWTAPNVMFNAIKPFLDQNPEANILDIGTGTGLLCELIRRSYPRVRIAGIDVASNMLRAAKDKGVIDAFALCNVAHDALPVPDSCVDLVTSCGVFEFIEDLNYPMSEISRVLKPSGMLAMTTMKSDGIFNANELIKYGKLAVFIVKKSLATVTDRRFPNKVMADIKKFKHSSTDIRDVFFKANLREDNCTLFTAFRRAFPVTYRLHLASLEI